MGGGPGAPVGLVVVGPGAVGLSLAAGLARSGAFGPVAVVGRRAAASPFLRRSAPKVLYFPLAGREGSRPAGPDAARSGEERPAPRSPAAGEEGPARETVVELWEGCAPGPVLLFAVPDDALSPAAAAWAGALARAGLPPPAAALHASGFHPSSVLAPLATAGAEVASWHPLVALAGPRTEAFAGRTVAIEGGEAGLATAKAIAKGVGARTVRVAAREKARWHAATAFASNGLVACLSVAAREAAAASAGETGLEDLLPLARSALEEVAARGLEGGLTGPVARGDARTVVGHLDALDPAAAALYRLLAAELARLAASRLDPASRRALARALGGEPGAEERGDAVRDG